MKKLTGESMNITEENLKAMQQLFPEAFEEGKIDFDVLRQLLGDFVDDEQERYSFKWNGKGKALRLSQTPSMGTLRPCKEESKDWDNTENLYIEGDNLEVLKLLQKSYYGKVKMIYIDPPYNTGNDFVYKDDFRDNIENYKEITRQVDEDGNWYSANGENRETNGRFHTDWLNMMYPRLRIARNLLSNDGVMFISIDYNENYNLREICDSIFGDNGFVGEIYWESKTKSQNTITAYNKLQPKAEMILVYSKQDKRRFNLISRGEKEYNLIDENGEYREHILEVMNANGVRGRETMIFDISDGVSTVSLEEGKQWQLGQDQVATYKNRGDLFIRDNKVVIKMRPNDERNELTDPFWGFFSKELGTTESAKKELTSIIGKHGFETVKPVEVIKRLVYHGTEKEDVILDFFSGSATTAHAVMQLNAEDGGHRKFIMVQLPEPTDKKSEAYKAGYKNICEIGKERIRRAGEKIKAEAGDKAADLDIGFKVFKLDSSNLQKWNPQPDDLVMTLQQAMDNFLPDRTEQDVLYEIILKMGLELTCQIEEEQAAGETVYIIGGGALMICLGQNITTAVAEAVVKLHEEYESELWQVVFRDTGFASDMDKTNVKETLKAAGLDEDSFVCV
jgi:adenine-specific DNA-methyltransferase